MTRARARRRRSARATGAWMERKSLSGARRPPPAQGVGQGPGEARAGARLTRRGGARAAGVSHGSGPSTAAALGEPAATAGHTQQSGPPQSVVQPTTHWLWAVEGAQERHEGIIHRGRRARDRGAEGNPRIRPARRQIATPSGRTATAVRLTCLTAVTSTVPVKDPHSQNGRKCPYLKTYRYTGLQLRCACKNTTSQSTKNTER